jgi:hypothetical protein
VVKVSLPRFDDERATFSAGLFYSSVPDKRASRICLSRTQTVAY